MNTDPLAHNNLNYTDTSESNLKTSTSNEMANTSLATISLNLTRLSLKERFQSDNEIEVVVEQALDEESDEYMEERNPNSKEIRLDS